MLKFYNARQVIAANDRAIGDQHLRGFQDNYKIIPTILTTSHKLSTGVDARNVLNIVLMRLSKSTIEFKQIIGRGTRVYEGGDSFPIRDFVKAYENFKDPEWDGEHEDLVEPAHRTSQTPTDSPEPTDLPEDREEREDQKPNLVIKLTFGKALKISVYRVQYLLEQRQVLSSAEFVDRLFGDLSGLVSDEDQLRKTWSDRAENASFLRSPTVAITAKS
ncbi:hypothetical protein [Sulfitobacter sp. W074]|uniref:hypothetical protein n=1 Tax=Sulfitobacter sp. W074 TaxID=2867026 RepID=UPI0021A8749A|nr:hypothetical protein [Sulfitobacter sp. W074]UWR38646.1 hypothetical protein K3762_06390 [Sulfitobacter sp. W074]